MGLLLDGFFGFVVTRNGMQTKRVWLLALSILAHFPLMFGLSICFAQQRGEDLGAVTPPTATPTATPTTTPVPPPPPSFCDGKTVQQISLGDQDHDGVKFKFKTEKVEYDSPRNRWYTKEKGASWVCAKNPKAATLGTSGVNLVYDFSMVRSNASHGQYERQREWTVTSSLFTNLFNHQAAKSCFLCGLVRWEGGCFPHGVNILTGDGVTYKAIERFSAGESIWNPVLRKAIKILSISEGPEKKALVVVETESARLRASTEHPMITTRGLLQARDIRVGDVVEDSTGNKVKVRRVSREKPEAGLSVINFVLERHGSPHDGLMVAEGLVVGDLIVQHELAARRKK